MKTVAVIFGGRSTEHDVSVVTALASVIKPLELSGEYQAEPVYISRAGAWYWDAKLKDISLFSSGRIESFLRLTKPAGIQFKGANGGMSLTRPRVIGKESSQHIDVVFPAMHGTYGEDGRLMGLLDMAGVPYVGCGQAASVLAMDKVLAKLMAENHGIRIAKFQYFSKQKVSEDMAFVIAKCLETLKFPMFVKPAHLGSSIGISRAVNKQELQNAIEVAVHYDDKILVEEAVENLIEVTLPIIGNDQPMTALLERPLTASQDFFDFETKYMNGGKKGGKSGQKGGVDGAQGYSELPAKLPQKLEAQALQVGLDVYKALGCSGIARVDMLIDSKTEKVYFNEVNPLPGSLYAHNWRAAGVSNVELVKKLIAYAEQRHAAEQSLTTVFETNYLQQF